MMGMTLNEKLIGFLRGAEQAHDSALESFNATTAAYDLSEAGRQAELDKLAAGIAGKIDKLALDGVAAIDAKIEELDKVEADRRAVRYADTDYQQRLKLKLDTAAAIAEGFKQAEPGAPSGLAKAEFLKEYLGEFESDPVALRALEAVFGFDPMAASQILPEDRNGVRQERMRKARGSFISTMESCKHLVDEHAPGGNKIDTTIGQTVNGMVTYLQVQDADFSRSEAETWERMQVLQTSAAGTAAAPQEFHFNFAPVSER